MPFDLQPTLKGELLELRPVRAEDFQELFAVASDPLIWEQHPANDRYNPEVFNEFFRQAMESGGALVAIDLRDGRMIGSSRFNGYDEVKSEAFRSARYIEDWNGGEICVSTRSQPNDPAVPPVLDSHVWHSLEAACCWARVSERSIATSWFQGNTIMPSRGGRKS